MKNNFAIILFFAVLAVLGALAAFKLPIRLEPTKTAGSIQVSYGWEGASPELIEQRVTSKFEGVFGLVQGVQKISSFSGYHQGSITLELDKNVPIDELRFELATLVRQLYHTFPEGVSYPTIKLNNPNEEDQEKPLFTLQLNGPESASNLQQYGEYQLSPQLSRTKGVHEVSVFGGSRLEYVVKYDLDRLNALKVSERDLLGGIRQHLSVQNIGIAALTAGQEVRVVLKSEEEVKWQQIIVKRSGDRLVRLGDIASISRQAQPSKNFYRINGQNAINIVVMADVAANQLAVADELKKNIEAIKKTLPKNFNLRIEYDATEFIKQNLNQIAVQSGLAVAILLLFVLLTSRSRRYTALILVSMIVNLLLSALLFYVFKIEIHLYSLAALTTSLGIIIDNVIVMIDHYKRYRNLSVFTALLGATFTTCAGLVVLWFLPDEVRYDLWDFALVLLITLLVSLAVALWFVPAVLEFSGAIASSDGAAGRRRLRWVVRFNRSYENLIGISLRFRKTTFVVAILAFGLPIFILPTKLEKENVLAKYYNPILGSELYTETLKPTLDKWLGGTLRLFVNYVYEGSYFTKPERTMLYVIANLPNQSTIAQMNSVFEVFEKQFGQYPEIDRTITHVYNGQEGNMVIYFKPEAEQAVFPYILKNRAIALSTEMSGISWDIYGVGQGFSQNLGENESPTFTIALRGFNYNELDKQAQRLKVMLEKHPRIQQVNANQSPNRFQQKNLYEYSLQTNEIAMATEGVSKAQVYESLVARSARPEAAMYAFVNGEYTPIKIVPRQAEAFDLWQLNHQALPNKDTAFYRLGNLSKIVRHKVTPEIIKENQEYLRLVSFDYMGSSRFGGIFLKETIDKFRPQLPLGYTVKSQDENWWSTETRKQYELIGVVMLLIYIICAIIFESLVQPFALISLIPLSFIGVFLAFYWFDFNFDQGGYASFILLSGNVVCAGIFLIAEYNAIRQRFPRKSPLKTYLKAYHHKIVPIFLTVVSTILGLVPFLIYGQNETFWFALGVGTIGGLLMSLVVIILFLPSTIFSRRQI